MTLLSNCHCCGFNLHGYLPWGVSGNSPDYSICDNCGIEWGYEDCTEDSLTSYRESWIQENQQNYSYDLRLHIDELKMPLPAGIQKIKINQTQ